MSGVARRTAGSRQGKEKGSTFALLTDAPDGSTVPMDDLLHCGQADAGSGILSGVMQPLEWGEEICSVLHVESDAIILNI